MSRKIEDHIIDTLTGDARRNALDFVDHLRASEIPLEESDGYWEVGYKNSALCFLLITGDDEVPGSWTIWVDQEPGAWAS